MNRFTAFCKHSLYVMHATAPRQTGYSTEVKDFKSNQRVSNKPQNPDGDFSRECTQSALKIIVFYISMQMSSILVTHDTIVQNNVHQELRHDKLKTMLAELISQPNQTIQRIQDMGEGGGDVAARLMTHGQQVLSGIRNNSQPQQGTDDTVTQLHVEFQEPRTKEYRELRNALTELSNRLHILPNVKDLNGLVKREGDIPVSGGTYSDVWMGTCLGRKVALKALREVRTTAKKAVKVRSHKNSIRYHF